MNNFNPSQSLRRRLGILFKEVMALNMTKSFQPPLSINRLSGAVSLDLSQDDAARLSEDQLVDRAVNVTQEVNLDGLLARYDAAIAVRAVKVKEQTAGIVNNMIPKNAENREQVVADTLDMLARFRLVKSIPGIKALIKARLENQDRDVDELDYLHLT